MMLSEEKIQAAENGEDPTKVGSARGLSNSNYRKWPGGIVPYTLRDDAGIYPYHQLQHGDGPNSNVN